MDEIAFSWNKLDEFSIGLHAGYGFEDEQTAIKFFVIGFGLFDITFITYL